MKSDRERTAVLHTLTYSSVASFAMADSEVAALLARSRELNAAEGITGLLVHIRLHDGRAAFLQVLEGPRHAVEDTFARIERDELHEDVTVLHRGPVESARFQRWSMRFATVDESGLGAAIGTGTWSDALLRDRATMDRVIAALDEN